MKKLLTAAFALSLLSTAGANAQQPDDHHEHGMGGGRSGAQGSAPPAAAPGPPAPPQGLGGRGQPGQGAAPSGPQYSHGNGPAFGSQGQVAPQSRPQGQGRPQGPGPQQGYQGRPQGQGPQQGYQGGQQGRGGAQAYGGPAPRDYRGQGGGRHEWNAGQRFRGPAYDFPRGFGYRAWSFGQFLPAPFFADNYTLYDYWDYGLPTPPYGFEWVRVGADALLVRPVDGYILDVAHNLFW